MQFFPHRLVQAAVQALHTVLVLQELQDLMVVQGTRQQAHGLAGQVAQVAQVAGVDLLLLLHPIHMSRTIPRLLQLGVMQPQVPLE
tara:strand:- start:7 stop:264 length:258 start_codon:yes stop_codon:yes gene_type:complete